MHKIKNIVETLFSLAVLAILVLSCSPASLTENSVSNDQLPVVTEVAQSSHTEQSTTLEYMYGIQVAAKSLCSDGVNTTLILQTDLDPEFWQLSQSDFYPTGNAYYETSILFLDNHEMYSTVSSGKRDDPSFDSQKKRVSIIQTFVFPKIPSPNSEFTVKAKVWLGNLPAAYIPPTGLNFFEPGALEVPMEYVTSVTLGECP